VTVDAKDAGGTSEPRSPQPSPYVGPRPYGAADNEIFFGREHEIAEVCATWLAARVTILHGPAAVGKTSLLCAGVVPSMSERHRDIDLLPVGRVVHQAARPAAAEPESYAYTLISSWAPAGIPLERGISAAEFLRRRPARRNRYGDLLPVLAAIDHFEELYTAFPARDAEREQVIDQLAEALEAMPTLRLLLVIRDDHLADLAADERRLSEYPAAHVGLGPLTPEAAELAVAAPAKIGGQEFGPEVVARIVEELRTFHYVDRLNMTAEIRHEFVEPMSLQIVCARLWPTSAAGEPDLPRAGGLVGFDTESALAEFYTAAIGEVARLHSVSETDLHNWLLSTFITQPGTRASTVRGIVMTDDMRNEIPDALVERRVLIREQRAIGTWYQLSQGRLVHIVRRAAEPTGAQLGDTGGEPRPDPSASDYRVAAVDAMGRGDLTEAARLASDAVEQFRASRELWKRADTLALLGTMASAEGDLPQSRRHYLAAVKEFTALDDQRSVVRLYVTLAQLHFLSGDFANAVYFGQLGVRHAPRDRDALTALGYALWYGGSPADARAQFNRVLGADASAPAALSGRGQVQAELEAVVPRPKPGSKPIADLDGALDLGLPSVAEEADARSARALALASRGRLEEADAELAAASALAPGRSLTSLRAALVHERAGDVAGACDLLDQSRRELPPLSPWHAELARNLDVLLPPRAG
jgi:tetratricopeptide (TPR) repeat protein